MHELLQTVALMLLGETVNFKSLAGEENSALLAIYEPLLRITDYLERCALANMISAARNSWP